VRAKGDLKFNMALSPSALSLAPEWQNVRGASWTGAVSRMNKSISARTQPEYGFRLLKTRGVSSRLDHSGIWVRAAAGIDGTWDKWHLARLFIRVLEYGALLGAERDYIRRAMEVGFIPEVQGFAYCLLQSRYVI
jgi:hypothetical protein